MRIGIMSMQRVINYGSFLQAYGLKSIIKALGYETEFIDFRVNDNNSRRGHRSIKELVIKGIRFILHRMSSRKRKLYKKAKQFEFDFASYFSILGISREYNYDSNVDLLVIGSDEVFNCYQSQENQVLSYDLFGKNSTAKSIVSYAASFGSTKYDQIVAAGFDGELRHLFEKFDYISVRDSNSHSILSKIKSTDNVYMHLDPVLMYDFDNELVSTNFVEPYIIVYAYRGRITAKEGKHIREFARKKKMKLYCLGGVQDFCDDFILASPFEVLGLVKGASYVITDTFHGTIFSIKYGVKFATIIRDNNRQKLYDLLCKFSLTNREVHNMEFLEEIIEEKYDTENVNDLIKEERIKTIDYLKRCIDSCGIREE